MIEAGGGVRESLTSEQRLSSGGTRMDELEMSGLVGGGGVFLEMIRKDPSAEDQGGRWDPPHRWKGVMHDMDQIAR